MPGFRITANQVTVARLLPMPILSWWCYQALPIGPDTQFKMISAIVVGTIIGSTDFVDGYLARRQGPTVLGGLLDPIADKVFVAFCYVPFVDEGYIWAWACGLMFVREFLVTALRSAYEQRAMSMKTSYIAKAKTWTQMQGIGVLMLFPVIDHEVMTWLLAAGLILPLVFMAGLGIVKRKLWRGALVMSGWFALILPFHIWSNDRWSMQAIMLGVLALTWISAVDYFVMAFGQLRGRGDFTRADAVRIIGAVALPSALFGALVKSPAPAWPFFVIMAVELAAGGLDNLLSHHRRASSALAWGTRTLGTSAILGLAILLPGQATWITVFAAAVSTAGVTWEFWRGRDYYLDARLRDERARGGASPVATGS